MRFFVPAFNEADAERLWAGTRQWLSGLGLATTRRRIRALACAIEGRDHFVAVGGDPPDGDEPVLVILESSNLGIFYVCTPSRGVLDDIPYPMWLDERWRVIDFDEEVCGHA
jgi:hypothetical protein